VISLTNNPLCPGSSAEKKVSEIAGLKPGHIPRELLDSDEPLVLRGLVSDWPSVREGIRGKVAIVSYLRDFCRNQEVMVFRGAPEINGRFFYNEDLSGFNFEKTSAMLESLLTRFASLEDGEAESCLYIGSTSVDGAFPGFRQDNDLPLQHLSPLVSIWMGNRTRIAAHFDSPDNIACVVAGRRRFTLFPPEQLANLYVGPLDFTPAGQAISLVDFHQPDYQRFPLFRKAEEAARVVDLHPGDAIYIPSMWWHHVESLDSFNILVNYWWRPLPAIMGAPMDALLNALLSIKGLPADQKRAWQSMFEHYIFSEEADLFSHIPEQSLGILGQLDEATARQLRSILRAKLVK
jgi:hypothetical protein